MPPEKSLPAGIPHPPLSRPGHPGEGKLGVGNRKLLLDSEFYDIIKQKKNEAWIILIQTSQIRSCPQKGEGFFLWETAIQYTSMNRPIRSSTLLIFLGQPAENKQFESQD
jgi:hypothetical protein